MRKLTKEDVKNLVIGGCILGGGGGGSMKLGEKFGLHALTINDVNLVSIDELSPEDLVVCASMVGAPSASNTYYDEIDFKYTLDQMEKELNKEIKAIFTNENGGGSSFNGFIQSAISGLPLIDTIGNGRAHPTGVMGSLSLHKLDDYMSIQTYSGGNPKLKNKIQGFVSGNLEKCSKMIRMASVQAGGAVVVMRNPVNVEYLKENGAIGGLTHAIEVGAIYNKAKKQNESPVDRVVKFLNGEIIAQGAVENYKLTMEGGFDVGSFEVDNYTLKFWNEYMLAKSDSKEFNFPDLIMTFDANTFDPISSDRIKEDMEVIVIGVAKENLKLASTMFDKDLLAEVDEIIKEK